MIISSIVIATIYACYNIVWKQYNNYRTSNRSFSQTLVLKTLIEHDLNQASRVQKEDDNEFTCLGSEMNELVRYVVLDSGIVRKVSETRDTFPVKVKEMEVLFEGQNAQDGNLVDEIRFSGNFNKIQGAFHFSKMYDSETLLKLEKEN